MISKARTVGETTAVPNPGESSTWRNRYLFSFGAYGNTHVLAFANSLEDGLGEAVDWLRENAPGLLCTDEVHAEFERLVATGMDEDDAREEAEVDCTPAGGHGDYIRSWEWGVVENPDRATLLAVDGRGGVL